jgi:Zn-dependent peptidase ImmA (M78 family)
MSQFEVVDNTISYISNEFDVETNIVKSIHAFFNQVLDGVKYQYLAHIIRTMEIYIRQKTNNPIFQINCQQLDIKSQLLNVGCAQYFPKKFFTIFFHPRMEERQLRVCLAHELGHLFLIECVNDLKKEGEHLHTAEAFTEPLSSIFGVFTILDKNKFYESCCSNYNHKSWESIVSDFVFLGDKAGANTTLED